MGKRTLAVLAALLAVFGAAALRAVAEGNGPASAPTSKAAPGAANGQKIVSDRTMADINEAETAMKEQSKKESATSAKRWATGVYTDHSGYVFKYGLSRPVKEEPGVKYPLHIGTPTALAMPSSQGQYPCYTLAIYIPDTILTPVAGGYKMPPDINLLVPSGYKGVIDRSWPTIRTWMLRASGFRAPPSMACSPGARPTSIPIRLRR